MEDQQSLTFQIDGGILALAKNSEQAFGLIADEFKSFLAAVAPEVTLMPGKHVRITLVQTDESAEAINA